MSSSTGDHVDDSEAQKGSASFGVIGPSRREKKFFVVQAVLRALCAIFTLASLIVLVSDSQAIDYYGIPFEAHYDSTSANRFFVGVDAVVFTFSILSALFLFYLRRSQPNFRNHFLLFLLDLVMLVMMVAGCTAATTVGYIAKYGEEKLGWLTVCNLVAKFCDQSSVSFLLAYLATICCLFLCISSARMLARVSAQLH